MMRTQTARHYARRAAPLLMNPSRAMFSLWRRVPVGGFDLRCDLDLHPRPHYAYGVQQAADLARRLGHPCISVLEFGVAGGGGLLELERLASLASEAYDVRIEVYGFDRTVGLPPPEDYRDLPYTWRESFFEMDVEALRRRLSTATLVAGDIASTVSDFVATHDPAPVGFVSIDVDYYSSARDALRVFEHDDRRFLPRVFVYLDDVVGDVDQTMHNEFVGELRAVRDFNEEHDTMKLAPIHGLAHKRPISAAWNDSMYSLHRFAQADYPTYVGPPPETQHLKLES